MQQVKQRGSTLLKVVGIILIIFGAISLLGGLATAAMGSMTASLLGIDEYGMQFFRINGILSLISGVVYLCVGILGVRLCNRAGKEGLLLLLGIIMILVTLFTTLYSLTMVDMETYVLQQILDSQMLSYGFAATDTNISSFANNPVSIGIGFILPVLFVIGALRNRMRPKPVYTEYMYGQQGANPYAQPGADPYAQQGPNPYAQPGANPYAQPGDPYAPQHPGQGEPGKH